MSNHENLAKQNNQPAVGVSVRQKLTVVSGMTHKDVATAEAAVHLGHIGQMPKFQVIAAENLRVHTGLPVDIFRGSKVVDLRAWKERNMVGEYYKSPDGGTFTYTEIVEERGSERVGVIGDSVSIETVAFTDRSRAEVINSLGEPEGQEEQSNIISFPGRQELRPTG